ncbi:hypothetical protein NEHOM01_2414 [Nematocida homosporus]|uniref:uncharacterized protein n=1 Tax=Nematocida homosporus TaxID=1912981 RepID=UPI0022205428|nr:uncharacterized protein NEHOM01_2414 [Nematocida homosporus]KAI5187859.1 hypothetical protein NEHOM01_2414 [Nematocida homosporus]
MKISTLHQYEHVPIAIDQRPANVSLLNRMNVIFEEALDFLGVVFKVIWGTITLQYILNPIFWVLKIATIRGMRGLTYIEAISVLESPCTGDLSVCWLVRMLDVYITFIGAFGILLLIFNLLPRVSRRSSRNVSLKPYVYAIGLVFLVYIGVFWLFTIPVNGLLLSIFIANPLAGWLIAALLLAVLLISTGLIFKSDFLQAIQTLPMPVKALVFIPFVLLLAIWLLMLVSFIALFGTNFQKAWDHYMINMSLHYAQHPIYQ